MGSTVYLAFPLMIVLAVLQTAVFSRLPILNNVPQIILLASISWGLLRGVTEGVVWAFIGGFILDLFTIAPMGLTAVSYITAVFVTIWLQESLPQSRFFTPLVLAGLGTIIAAIVYQLGARLLGYAFSIQTLTSLPQAILLNIIVMMPMYWAMSALYNLLRPRRVHL